MRHMELFMVFQTKEGEIKKEFKVFQHGWVFVAHFPVPESLPSLRCRFCYTRYNLLCLFSCLRACGRCSGQDKNIETFCAHGWAGGKSWTQQDSPVQTRYEGLNLKALDATWFLKSHLYFHTRNTLIIGVGGAQSISKEVQILFLKDAVMSQNFWTHFQFKETFNDVDDRPDCLTDSFYHTVELVILW